MMQGSRKNTAWIRPEVDVTQAGQNATGMRGAANWVGGCWWREEFNQRWESNHSSHVFYTVERVVQAPGAIAQRVDRCSVTEP